MLLEVAPRRRLALGMEPVYLAEARERRPQVREVQFTLLVVVGKMAHLHAVLRHLDDSEGGIGKLVDPGPTPLLAEERNRQDEGGEREGENAGPHDHHLRLQYGGGAARRNAQ